MNTENTNNPPVLNTQVFYVSYFPGEPESLNRNVGDGPQFYQDFFVVRATGYEDALETAFELLEAKYGDTFTIAKVMSKAENAAVQAMMNRVERGEVPPATMADDGNDVWVERYLDDGKYDTPLPKST